MRCDVITIFPRILDSYVNESIIKRAIARKLLVIHTHDLREYTLDKHRKADDRQFGGGPGMVLKADPIIRAVKKISKKGSRVILLGAGGKKFDAKAAKRLSKYKQLVFVCGRYEGVDERIAQYVADEEISIGDYVLTGGELPAMVIIDAVARHIPGVLGKQESLEEERHGTGVPTYTRPEVVRIGKKQIRVPKVLLSGDPKKVDAWREKHKK